MGVGSLYQYYLDRFEERMREALRMLLGEELRSGWRRVLQRMEAVLAVREALESSRNPASTD